MKPILIVVVGPTAIGKTSVSIRLAQHFQTEIVSADSRQIYREMPIGTAHPSVDDLRAVKHHMIASNSVSDYFNASMFEEKVVSLLDHLFQEKPVVIMTGGSGLYINAVLKGIDDLPTIAPQIRDQLKTEYQKKGLEWLQMQVMEVDPDFFEEADIQNYKRLLKALEVFRMTGKPYSGFLTTPSKKRGFVPIIIGLNRERSELYEAINSRVDEMMNQGLEDEARNLLNYRNMNALNTVGYRELFEYFDGDITRDEAITKIKANTRKYARRQLTWFRKDKSTQWFHPLDINKIIMFLESEIKNFN